MNDRDTHFAGFAKLQFPEISKLFFTMYARIEEQRPIEEIDAIEDEIKTLLAQSDYDLVMHTVGCVELNESYYASVGYGIKDIVNSLPDLTRLHAGLYMTEKISTMKSSDLPRAFDTLENAKKAPTESP